MSGFKGLFKRSKPPASNDQESQGTASNWDSASPVTLVVVGCGQRGSHYSEYCLSHPKDAQVVAIAEPRPKTRDNFAATHAVDHSLMFSDWKTLLQASAETIATIGRRLADAVLVTVQDSIHCEVVLAFAEQGYHILCEKPMSPSIEDCVRMRDAVKKAGIIFGLGHVLRYSPYTEQITDIIRSRSLGDLINIVHVEPVGFYHFAHSYVRGHWSVEKESSFSLMTKSCHDLDLLVHWLSPATPAHISSFGSLKHFRKESKPKDAGNVQRCIECPLQTTCPYSAKRKMARPNPLDSSDFPNTVYLDPLVESGHKGWPTSTIVDGIPDIENVTAALQTSRYGQCVYELDNDVCDNQVVNLQFSNGATCSFTMVAFSSLICERQTRMHFTHGEIVGDMNKFTVTDFRQKPVRSGQAMSSVVHVPELEPGASKKHGGGDFELLKTFVRAVRQGRQEILGTDVDEILRSHLTVFAAEESRKTGKTIDVKEFEKEVLARIINPRES